jgi:hypothetical protein
MTMRKNTIVLAAAAASLLGAGIARAEVDMAIDDENERRRRAAADPLDGVLGDLAVAGRVADRLTGKTPELAMPYDEGHALKSQGDVYAEAAKAIMPGPDEPLPDRFSVNPENPFYDQRWAQVRIGVRFDGKDRPGDVEEYCVSEGWIRIQTFLKNGKVRRERGKIICIKQHGKVEPYRK